MKENRHFEEFGKPFPSSDVSWKIQITKRDKTAGKVVPYLDARAIADRLDAVVGQYNWKDDYGQWHCYTEEPKEEGKKPKKVNSQLCTIYIYDEERHEWIGKTDGAENTDFESVKGGLSDSFKRAAVKWNIGRYMYNFEPVWVNLVDEYGRPVIDANEYPRLEKIYNDTVIRLFGKETVGNSKSGNNKQGNSQNQQSGNSDEKKKQQGNTGNPPTQQNASQSRKAPTPDIYEIKSIRCEGEGQTVKTTLVVDKNGNKSTMFYYGQDKNLKTGTKITNLRGKRTETAYGPHLILEQYDLAA